MNYYKIRFFYDSLLVQRLYYPKFLLFSKFIIISWRQAINLFFRIFITFKYNFIESYFGSYLGLDSFLSLKFFLNSFGCSNLFICAKGGSHIDFRFFFQLMIL